MSCTCKMYMLYMYHKGNSLINTAIGEISVYNKDLNNLPSNCSNSH